MNLPTSSTASGRSRPKPPSRDFDYQLKLKAATALARAGNYVRINVLLSAVSEQGLADVTDVDVLAIAYDFTFTQRCIAVSCKGGQARSLSPARESFFLRGVLTYLSAGQGVILYSARSVDPHLKDLGRALDVLLLSGPEVDTWLESLTKDLPDPGYFVDAQFLDYAEAVSTEQLKSLGEYLKYDYWFYRDFRNIQNVIGHLKKLERKPMGSGRRDAVQVLEVCAHLAITILDLCRHLRLLGVDRLPEQTAAYIFGGPALYKARRDLHQRVQLVLSRTGVMPPAEMLPPLEPTYTGALAELALRFIERPLSAILVPLVLQDFIWRELGAAGLPQAEDKVGLAAEKLAQDLIDFVKTASGLSWAPTI